MIFVALYLLPRSPGERRVSRAVPAAFLLGVAAISWPAGSAQVHDVAGRHRPFGPR